MRSFWNRSDKFPMTMVVGWTMIWGNSGGGDDEEEDEEEEEEERKKNEDDVLINLLYNIHISFICRIF